MDIFYQFNEKYAPYAGTSITSLFENNKETSITVHILGENLSADSIEKFNELANSYSKTIVFYDTQEVIKLLKSLGVSPYRGSYAANLRMFPSYFIDESIERLLYLDADTIVVGDVLELFDTFLGEKAVGMVIDSLGNSCMKTVLNISSSESYYNSGVILYDMKTWRKQHITEKIIEFIEQTNRRFTSPDQDILNSVLVGQIAKLSPKYNMQPFHMVYSYNLFYKYYGTVDYYSSSEVEMAKCDVRIYHSFRYVGEFPWDKNTLHPYKELFDKYLRIGPWKDYERKFSESTFVMRVEKILYRILPRQVFLLFFSKIHTVYIKK